MSEPIAVAFVEVRPETNDFRANAERELRADLGADLEIRGNVRLDGLADARREVDALAAGVSDVSGQQLQFPGLDAAGRDAEALTASLGQAAEVNLATNLQPAQAIVAGLADEAARLQQGLVTLPQFAVDIPGLTNTAAEVAVLADESSSLNDSLNDTATAASGIADVAVLVQRATGGMTHGLGQAAAAVKEFKTVASGPAPGVFVQAEPIDPDFSRRIGEATQRVLDLQDELVAMRTVTNANENRNTEEAERFLAKRREIAEAIAEETRVLRSGEGPRMRLVSTEEEIADAVADSARQTRDATKAEGDLADVRLKARRAAPLGPFRLAGVGLLAGTAVFAATRALGDLSDALRVTGDDASTFEGKLRNVSASVLSGDLVGAFKALADNTKTYTTQQLLLINQTPRLTEVLKELGEASNLARSTTEALAGLGEVPQFLQTALAREEAQGDVGGQIRVLEEQLAFFERAESIARQIAQTQEQRNAILEPIFDNEARIRDQLRELREGRASGGRGGAGAPLRTTAVTGVADQLADELKALEQERDQLNESLPRGDQAASDLARQRDQLSEVNRRIEQEKANIIREQDRHAAEARDDAVSSGGANFADAFENIAIAAVDTSELQALQREKVKLEAAIAGKEREAAGLKTSRDRLEAVNKEIEATVASIKEEQRRHAEELRGDRLQQARIGVLEAENFGTEADVRAALVAERDLILAQLNNKKISADERERLNGQLRSVNSQIEALADAATAEAQRHADEMAQKLADADDAFLRSLDRRESALRNAQTLAEASAGLADDIRVSNQLQALFREQIRVARDTINDARLKAETIAELRAELARETQNERDLRAQQRRERVDRRAESLELDIQIAQANDNTKAEIRARRARIRFLQERIRTTREGTNQRKRLILELRQEQAAIRDLQKEGKDQADESKASFEQLSFSFLQERDRLEREFASNIDTGLPSTLQPPAPQQRPLPIPPKPKPPEVPSPLARPRGIQGDQGAAAEALREGGGKPASEGQLEALIALTRETNLVLKDIRRGVGHNEARSSRALSKNAVVVGAD